MVAAGLLILKIIGFILLGILGLILAVLLLILLVPIRYRAEGSYYEALKATISISWLLHILSCKVIYEEELDIIIKVFGFRIGGKSGEPVMEEPVAEEPASEKPVSEEPVSEKPVMEEPVTEGPLTEDPVREAARQEKTAKAETIKEPKKRFSFQKICDKLEEIKQRKEEVLDFVRDEDNQATFRLLWKQLKALLKHILPGKVRGKIRFGFDDPYTTGQVLSYVSPFYGWYGKQFQLIPVFETSIFEGEGWLKGRIRIGTVLFLGVRVLFDKNFRTLLKRWRE